MQVSLVATPGCAPDVGGFMVSAIFRRRATLPFSGVARDAYTPYGRLASDADQDICAYSCVPVANGKPRRLQGKRVHMAYAHLSPRGLGQLLRDARVWV